MRHPCGAEYYGVDADAIQQLQRYNWGPKN